MTNENIYGNDPYPENGNGHYNRLPPSNPYNQPNPADLPNTNRKGTYNQIPNEPIYNQIPNEPIYNQIPNEPIYNQIPPQITFTYKLGKLRKTKKDGIIIYEEVTDNNKYSPTIIDFKKNWEQVYKSLEIPNNNNIFYMIDGEYIRVIMYINNKTIKINIKSSNTLIEDLKKFIQSLNNNPKGDTFHNPKGDTFHSNPEIVKNILKLKQTQTQDQIIQLYKITKITTLNKQQGGNKTRKNNHTGGKKCSGSKYTRKINTNYKKKSNKNIKINKKNFNLSKKKIQRNCNRKTIKQ
jgi:hypothetical protein